MLTHAFYLYLFAVEGESCFGIKFKRPYAERGFVNV
ncbi:hypothetical protein EZS27_018004, partial [termite gut metagenome]